MNSVRDGFSARVRIRMTVAAFGLSALSIHCGAAGPALQPIDLPAIPDCPKTPTDEKVRYLATASPSGTYVKLGDAIVKASTNKSARPLKVCTSAGSNENLELLRNKSVSFAFVQLDALHYEIVDNQLSHDYSSVRLVTFLYSEKLHLFVRPHLYLTSLSDLNQIGNTAADKRQVSNKIWLGPNGGGARETASKVLQAAGIADEDIDSFGSTRKDLNWERAANCLLASKDKRQGVIAYFRTMAVPRHCQVHDERAKRPVSVCKEISVDPGGTAGPGASVEPMLSVDDLLRADAQLMALPPALIDRLTEEGLYVRTTIDLGSYHHLKRGVPTIGIPTVLLTNLPDGDADAISALISDVGEARTRIETHIGGIELDQLSTQDIEGVRTHPGAQGRRDAGGSWLVWLGLFLLGSLAAIWRDPLRFRRRLAAASYVWLLIATLSTIWILLSVQMMQVEGRLNPDFSGIEASLWTTLRLLSGQARDYRLMTAQGETWRWLGLFLFPVIIGWLFSDVVKTFLQSASNRLARLIREAQARDAHRALIALATTPQRLKEWIRGRPSRGSLVFFNWNERAERMMGELRQQDAFVDRQVVIIGGRAFERLQSGDVPGVSVVDGDPTARTTMERAGIVNADAVTVISAWGPADPNDRRRNLDPDMADTKTILAILAIRTLCEELHRSRVLPIKAEIRLARNQEEAKNAARGGRLELTCVSV